MERPEEAPQYQIAALCGLIAVIAIGELLIGPPVAKAWTPLDAFLALGCFAVGAMLLSARAFVFAWPVFAFLGGAIVASMVLPLPGIVWLGSHVGAVVAGVSGGGLFLVRRA